MNVFSEETIPIHLCTEEFFASIRTILSDQGCVSTNANLSTIDAFRQLKQTLFSTFEMNILFAHNSIVENARLIISGRRQTLRLIASFEQAIREAQRFQLNAHLEFSLSRIISLAYQGPVTENTIDIKHMTIIS